MSKHTPGPWRLGHFTCDDHPCDCRYIFGNDDRMGAVAEVFATDGTEGVMSDNPPPEEVKANMRLIAAAPDMLEALRYVETRCVSEAAYPHASIEDRKMRDLVVAAILKAEGGAA